MKQVQDCRRSLEELLTRKAEGALRYASQRYYEKGNRASRLLAFQLRKEQSNRIVSKIKHPTSPAEFSRPEEVAEAFQVFYKKLYDPPEKSQDKRKLE